MPIMKNIFLLIIFGLIAINAIASEKIAVVASIQPLSFFVERIGGELVEVSVMIPPNGNPHTYEPTPSQMEAVSDADIFVKVGTMLNFEQIWVLKLFDLNPKMKVVDASAGIRRIGIRDDGHGHGHHHGQGASDPHTWLSLPNAIIMVANIKEALVNTDPKNKEIYSRKASNLIVRLSDIHRENQIKFANLTSKSFFIYHPAWGYFAQDYDLNQVVIEQQGKEPSAKDLARIVRQAKAEKIKTIFVEPQYSQRSARMIAEEIGAEIVEVNPLAKEYLQNMKQAVDAFVRSAE